MSGPFHVTDTIWRHLCPIWNRLPRSAVHSSRRARFVSLSIHQQRRAVQYDTRAVRPREKAREEPDDVLTVDSLHTRLNTYAGEGNIKGCQRVIAHLLQTRGGRLSTNLYNALILSNVDAATGGAWRVRELLQEMERERYVPDVVTCHNILRVLAVHPDHLLRADILNRMRQNWFDLTREGHHDVAAGWLREGCIEMAMDVLETMQKQALHVEPWLLDMFVYSLCDAGQIESACDIMRTRFDSGELSMSKAVWHYFLDAASNARHLAGTELAWSAKVGVDQLHASTGIVENALATASLHGAPALATDVFAHLIKRGDTAKHVHYQQLIDSYMNYRTPDTNKALGILTIMAVERILPTKWQTRSLFRHIRSSPRLTARAFGYVRTLHQQGRIVPLAAVNLIIEAYAHQQNLPAALSIYTQIPSLLTNGSLDARLKADLETFQILFSALDTSQYNQGEDLLADMLSNGTQPDSLIYSRMIAIHARVAIDSATAAKEGESDTTKACSVHSARALALYDMMTTQSLHADLNALSALVEALAAAGNARCYNILESNAVMSAGLSRKLYEKISLWMPLDRSADVVFDSPGVPLEAHA